MDSLGRLLWDVFRTDSRSSDRSSRRHVPKVGSSHELRLQPNRGFNCSDPFRIPEDRAGWGTCPCCPRTFRDLAEKSPQAWRNALHAAFVQQVQIHDKILYLKRQKHRKYPIPKSNLGYHLNCILVPGRVHTTLF